MQEKDIITITATDLYFPDNFRRVVPTIEKFYAIGDVTLLTQGSRISIVGSRNPTSYGSEVTKDFTQAVVRAGITVVSGLAFGIDSIAHKVAISEGGKTIAVLPSGLKDIYPARHTELARRIVATGGLLISEFILDIPPMKYYFVRRNRLIAAISGTTLVTEAGEKSGSRHTADFAMELGLNVCVVPGNINSPLSIGTNNLIKEGAEPIVATRELLTILGVNEVLMKPRYSAQNRYEQAILDNLYEQNLSNETLLEASQLEVSNFNVHLTMLEIKGVIEQTASKSWRLAK